MGARSYLCRSVAAQDIRQVVHILHSASSGLTDRLDHLTAAYDQGGPSSKYAAVPVGVKRDPTSSYRSSASEGRWCHPSLDVAEADHCLENLERDYPKRPDLVIWEAATVPVVLGDPSALRLDREVDRDSHHNLLHKHLVIPWADILLVAGHHNLGEGAVEIAVPVAHTQAHSHSCLVLRIHNRHIQDPVKLDWRRPPAPGPGILPPVVVLLEGAFAVVDMP